MLRALPLLAIAALPLPLAAQAGGGGPARPETSTPAGSARQTAEASPSPAPGPTMVTIPGRTDPARDSPERLPSFAESARLDPQRWTLLNGDDGDVLAFSVLLGVKYRATDGGEFAHSNVLTVLDAEGRIIERVEGLNADLSPVLDAIRGAL